MGKLLREGNASIKQAFEDLLHGGKISMEIDEQIVYNQLAIPRRILSLLSAPVRKLPCLPDLSLSLAENREVTLMFEIMIQDWFSGSGDYNDFIKALLQEDVDAMNE